MKRKNIIVDFETFELLKICIEIYQKHHSEFEKILISKNKIIHEIAKFYIKTEPDYKHIVNE